MGHERLGEVLDIAATQALQDVAAELTGARLELFDVAGNAITQPSLPPEPGPAEPTEPRIFELLEPTGIQSLGHWQVIWHRQSREVDHRLLRLLAAELARAAALARQNSRQLQEQSAIYETGLDLAEARDLSGTLARSVRTVAQLMNVKAASIRLIDKPRDELRIAAAFGLSPEYVQKRPLTLSRAEIDKAAIRNGHEYVRDLSKDARVQFPAMPVREEIVSLLSVPLRYRREAIGVLRVYTGERRDFSPAEIELLKTIASQQAAAIHNARLVAEISESERLERQVRLARDVQHRMIPPSAPTVDNLQFAGFYEPSQELAGDFFDFIDLDRGRVGVVIGDVVGKGVAASLIMASVRAMLRATTPYLPATDTSEVMKRLNHMLCEDLEMGEFVSVFYGVFDGPSRRIHYTNAGHLPPLLLRDGALQTLTTGDIVLGVLDDTDFATGSLDLHSGDRLLLQTDGLLEAMNFEGELFGDDRVRQSVMRDAEDVETMVQNVLWDMRRFVGFADRSDDVTMVGVEVR